MSIKKKKCKYCNKVIQDKDDWHGEFYCVKLKNKEEKIDREIRLVDIPEIKVKEDKYHNLVLTFKERFCYEKGDTLKIWSSFIYHKLLSLIKKRLLEKIPKKLNIKGNKLGLNDKNKLSLVVKIARIDGKQEVLQEIKNIIKEELKGGEER